MKKYKAGFIGCGNMAAAIIRGIQNYTDNEINAFDIDRQKCEQLGDVTVFGDVQALVDSSDIIFLCIKPSVFENVLPKINGAGKAFVSIAAGVKSQKIKQMLGDDARVMRIMPNTPLMVGQGASCIETPNNFNEDEQAFVAGIFSKLGLVKFAPGELMDAVTGVSGSGPAYVYLFVDAVAKAGVKNGLDEKTSMDLAIQTFIGACEMLKTGDKAPDELIENVCSPGGTTIEAMQVFGQQNIRNIIEDAVDACVKKSKLLSE